MSRRRSCPPSRTRPRTVGLRGLTDSSYANYDPTVQNDSRAAGRAIGSAMADQVAIVRTAHPDASFITNLWQEGAPGWCSAAVIGSNRT